MTQNTSPLPKEIRVQNNDDPKEEIKVQEKQLFNFPTAIKYVSEGKKISRKEWENTKTYGALTYRPQDKMTILTLHKDDKDHAWIIQDGDLSGVDWFIVE